MVLLSRLDGRNQTDTFPDPQQMACQSQLSALHTYFNFHETIRHYHEREDTHVVFLDTSKAFDIVWHSGLEYNFFEVGIKCSLWTVLDDMYTGQMCRVFLDSMCSRPIPTMQAIRQGGVLSGKLEPDFRISEEYSNDYVLLSSKSEIVIFRTGRDLNP
ncbi:uncharacterized protein LOC124257476 [Haliotis rubra]|uniref:uncharacterized protein LOC124257476 n=1 Tax=Haliotis rubra TaxID=36100 RepID=UPI001EE56765|nr:uncharacterized protein LOC124257476 [Haliotis rubra]